jgi:membrane protease YdiL (CAAX protease family)
MTSQQSKGDISWKASYGWAWLLAYLIWVFICTKLLVAVIQFVPDLGKWLVAHFAFYNAAVTVLSHAWILLAAFLCSKSKSVRDFVHGLSLDCRPTLKESLFVLAAICLGFLSIICAIEGLTVGNWVGQVFHNEGGNTWSLYTMYACSVGPFAEEVSHRGFLYRAFRGNYGMSVSIALIVCLNIFCHWQMASHSFLSLGLIILFAILACIIREKTGSTWNCIFFHAVYNTITLRQWPICIVTILIFLFVASKNKTKQQTFAN